MSDEEVFLDTDPPVDPEPLLGVGKFEGPIPRNSAYIRWDVKGGRSRDHCPKNIQGYTCRSAIDIWIYLGHESQRFPGPT
ncbi:hypothetical protein FSPOR_3125 [Fusarium sporotrichioides]|uniref:Uncharacterized protein n=1 Tax=Fusarium sporotrichioides TaxID=5514 RepID=A0A395SI67_FUSSP|nr:hypothetical protein FSPOR_3125 [Fusarium sporotrichioides]